MPGMRPVPMLTRFMRWVRIPHRQEFVPLVFVLTRLQ